MRLSASEKLEIIGLVEQSHLPARRTLQISRTYLKIPDCCRSAINEE